MFDKVKQDWSEMDNKFKALLVALVVVGGIGIFIQSQKNKEAEIKKASQGSEPQGPASVQVPGSKPVYWQAIPNSNRNQGLEDVLAEMQRLRADVEKLRMGRGEGGKVSTSTDSAATIDLNDPLPGVDGGAHPPKNAPPPVKFDTDMAASKSAASASLEQPKGTTETPTTATVTGVDERARMKVWMPVVSTEKAASTPEAKLTIPVNSALEAVMLSGINARPSGSIGGAVGSVNSANDVGAPFVSRIKGDATLPNGWKLSDLGDCFMSGSAVAVLSAERAYAISNTISCVSTNGDVYEAPIKAYGLDIDGIQGLAGKVVSKQGAILFQALLTGVASGLGTALTPTPIQGYNSAAQGGAQAVQYPDASTVAATAVGNGIHNATSQLSRFYLEYARETFPIIEVLAGTRVTWILKETVEFKRIKKGP